MTKYQFPRATVRFSEIWTQLLEQCPLRKYLLSLSEVKCGIQETPVLTAFSYRKEEPAAPCSLLYICTAGPRCAHVFIITCGCHAPMAELSNCELNSCDCSLTCKACNIDPNSFCRMRLPVKTEADGLTFILGLVPGEEGSEIPSVCVWGD